MPGFRKHSRPWRNQCADGAHGFSLIELLVVVLLIALLVGILLPALAKSRTAAKVTLCLANQRSLGIGVHTYAQDFKDSIPLTPDMPLHVGAQPVTPDAPTNQLFAAEPDPNDSRFTGHGMLLDGYLTANQAANCPDATRGDLMTASLDSLKLLNVDAYSNYLYRNRFATTESSVDGLGENLNGTDARALLFDFNQTNLAAAAAGPDSLMHTGTPVNALYLDGHANSHKNTTGRLSWVLGTTTLADIADQFALLDDEG